MTRPFAAHFTRDNLRPLPAAGLCAVRRWLPPAPLPAAARATALEERRAGLAPNENLPCFGGVKLGASLF